MADGLAEALLGLNFSPAQDPYGLAQQAVATSTPSLISPYASTGKAIGIGLGSVLLQSLLGYQARQSALQDTLQANTLANQMLKMQTPEERTALISQEGIPSAIGSRLSTLATALTAQELQAQQKLKDAVGLEVGKLKAIQQFYNTPEGIAARDFEIRKIKEEAEARRTPIEEALQKIAATGAQQRQTAVLKADLNDASRQKQNEFVERMKELDRKARSGDQQAKFNFLEKQKQVDADLKRELVNLGVDAAVEKKRRLDQLTMQNQELGQDPALALVNAKAEIAQELIEAREAASARLIEKAGQQRQLEAAAKKALDLANPKAPAALITQNVKRIGVSNMAVEIADDLDRYANWITYRVGTAFSATDEAALRSRLKKLTAEERLALSGTATNESERKDINEMLNGDFTAGPETKAMLLRRFAKDSRQIALDNMKGGFSSATDFIKAVEQSLQSGGRVEFGTPTSQPQVISTADPKMLVQQKIDELKAKYQVGSAPELKGKLSAADQQELAALVQAARR